MKIGVKTFDSEKFLDYFEDKSDFFEIMAIQKNDYSFLKKFSLPMVIHAEHQGFGMNPADISKKEQNLKSINFAINLADMVNSRKIIVHPGIIEKGNSNCSEENAINLVQEINDDRILMENLNSGENIIRLCSAPEEIKTFTEKTKTGFCFDVNHAIKNIKGFDGNYSFLKRYIKLNPSHYHLGGQNLISGKDHICLRDSNINLKEIFRCLPKNIEITLETESDIKKVEDDIKIVKEIIEDL